ncbi:uncharacterized protein K441DRAFT_585566 [Cenococcum geophilum 1.58]|uniref:uncharacterized protein n=1 Tax=Cenococcum geophilum 1.58 TaxID=794803 RepID=UPI00358ECF47|nr:hypothetical protein K441DRAFT_585566 [Cenococcum geophilum 1.58]
MGTLTAGAPRLAEHCPHKLATSCRLTATPRCCACADVRLHSTTYSVYIDGVGFVQRGTRWQSYCWFCKEFWNNRVAATDPPLQPSQARIPEVPDQTQFLERWFEFHQGYRTVRRENGSEDRIAVIGEPLKDVSPGYLPRTLQELRAGQRNDATRAANRTVAIRGTPSNDATGPEEPERTLEETIDNLLEEISDNEEHDHLTREGVQENNTPQSQLSRPFTRREQMTRRLTERLRENVTRVFGTREEIQSDDYQSPIAGLYTRAWDRYHQAEQQRREDVNPADPSASHSAYPALDIQSNNFRARLRATDEVDELARRIAEMEAGRNGGANLASQASSPADPSASHSAYPALGIQTNNFRARLRATGEVSELARRIAEMEAGRNGGANPASQASSPADAREPANSPASYSGRSRAAAHERIARRIAEIQSRDTRRPRPPSQDQPFDLPHMGLDSDNRPPPKTDAEMTVKLECQICYSQVADIACLPCGHMVMCKWCADITMPVRHGTILRRPSNCPMCRKKVSQRVRIHHG